MRFICEDAMGRSSVSLCGGVSLSSGELGHEMANIQRASAEWMELCVTAW